MTTTAIEKQKPQTLRQQLASDYFKQQVALALPKHMTPDRFVRVALTALMKTPKLLNCTPESVLECMLTCSQLGLEPDGRRAHLIPYGTICKVIVDYKGIVELAMRGGNVSNIYAQVVCENDSFSWDTGEIKHQIDFRRSRGDMYAAYTVITFKDGRKHAEVMTKDEIDAIRQRSKSPNEGPWVSDYGEMAKKTVFRRASKWITLSPEIADAFEKDDGDDFQPVKIESELSAKRLFSAGTDPEPISQTQNESPIEVQSEVAQEVTKEKPAAKAVNFVKGVRGLMKLAQIEESELLDFMRAQGLDDSLSSIEEISMAASGKLAAVYEDWQNVVAAINKLKGAK